VCPIRQSLTSKADQQWYIKANQTKIQLADTTLCMDAGPKSGWKDMANIYMRECSDTEVAQKWNAMADGRIALEPSTGTRKFDVMVRGCVVRRTNMLQNNVSIFSISELCRTTLLVCIIALGSGILVRRIRGLIGR
jgi:hypothetical protein